MTVIINGASLLALLLIVQSESGGEIPGVVTFAEWLAQAEEAQPVDGEWYLATLPALLLVCGDVAQGEDPEIARIAFYASAKQV